MYIPKFNLTTDTNEILGFMARYSFATVITAENNFPTGTHLPFVVEKRGDEVVLISHFAKANDQWKTIEENPVLVIFTESHAYISTKNYDKPLNVPTWNYVAVHAYGKAQIIRDNTLVMKLLEQTIGNFEADFLTDWNSFPEEYKLKMIQGIVAFEVTITDLQGKKKLSQNRSETEKKKIVETLSKSEDSNEKRIAELMRQKEM